MEYKPEDLKADLDTAMKNIEKEKASKAETIEDFSVQQAKNPTVPEGGVTKAV